jgi:predicted Zn finger-like uncharacterized protein
MDVTCERCGTVYEFEEALVSARGTTVKCTQCAHVFKVLPPGAVATSDAGWQLRKGDGATRTASSLRELQHQIAQGELSPSDELSRDGVRWKPLGEIAELQSFFPPDRPDPSPKRERQRTQLGLGPGSAPPPPAQETAAPPQDDPGRTVPSSPPPPRAEPPAASPSSPPPRTHKPTLMGVGGMDPDATRPARPAQPAEPAAPPPTEAPTVPGGPRPSPAPPDGAWTEGPGIPAPPPEGEEAAADDAPPTPSDPFADTLLSADPPPRRSVPTLAAAPRPPPATRPGRAARPEGAVAARRPLYLDEDDERPLPGQRSLAWVWIVALVLAVGGGVALAWPHLAPHLGLTGPDDHLVPFLDRAQTAMRRDEPGGYREAIREFTRASALAEDDPRVLVGLSRTHALMAQALAFQASDLEARSGEEPAREGEAALLRRESGEHAGEARELARNAVHRTPEDPDARLALADALRLEGKTAEADTELAHARTRFDTLPAELHRVEGLLAMARSDNQVAAAREGAERAVEADPDLLRARLLLARALLAERQVSSARAQVQAVLRRAPGHPLAAELERAIEGGFPPAAPLMEVLDGGTAEAPDAAAPDAGAAPGSEEAAALEDDDADPAPTGTDRSDRGGDAPPTRRDYAFHVKQGEALLEQGDVGQARRHFERALEERPGAPEALTGLGFVALDAGDTRGAIRRFEPAARGGYVDAFIGLGDAYRRTGRQEDALEAYRSYLERRPNGAHAPIARNQVRRLENEQPGLPAPDTAEPDDKPSAPPGAQEDGRDAPAADGDPEPGGAPPEDPPAPGSD